MIIDPRLAEIHGHYYDSWHGEGFAENIEVAQGILKGLRRMISYSNEPNRYVPDPMFINDPNAPHQFEHNACGSVDGNGACGPFVWAITKEFAQYIVDASEDSIRRGTDVVLDFRLPPDFAQKWRWNSVATRKTIRGLIERERRVRRHLVGTDEWFGGPDKTDWRNMLRDQEHWSWDPYADPSLLMYEVVPGEQVQFPLVER